MKTTASAAAGDAALDLCKVKLLLLGVYIKMDVSVGEGRLQVTPHPIRNLFPHPFAPHAHKRIHASSSVGVKWTTRT